MGVPGFFSWVLKNFNKSILLKKLSIRPDEFYIDANCLFHPECFKILENCQNETNTDKLENMMFSRILNYLDYLEIFVNPRRSMYISVDGTAPLAKIGQQRKRRFKSIEDAKIRSDIKKRNNVEVNDCWNNTVITPGTNFMERLHNILIKHYEEKKKAGSSIIYIYSSCHTFGEGEHKILQHIKKTSTKQNIDDVIVIYGLDADLIFLAMASGKQNIFLLREEQHFGQNKPNKLVDPVCDVAQDLMYVSISETKKGYNRQIWDILENRSKLDKYCTINQDTNFINDMIFICFLLGNDFLPHFPSLDIHRKGLDEIIDCYVECIEEVGQLLMKNNLELNNTFFILLTEKLGKREYNFFTRTLQRQIQYNKNKECFVASNKYAFEMWELDNLRNFTIHNPINLGIGNEDEWKFRYYEHYFHTSEHQEETIKNVVKMYLEGIVWVTQYYFNECRNWKWQYIYDHAPFISDVARYAKKININNIKMDYVEPVSTMIQLISVLPPQKNYMLPESYRKYVTGKNSPIIDLFPKKTTLDMLYKDQYWQCNPMLPYMNIDRIIKCVKDEKLTKDEKLRNVVLDDFVF